MKKMFSFLLVVLSVFILVSCGENVGIKEGSVNMNVGERKDVQLKGLTPEKVTFKSEDEDVVLIDETGSYIAIAPGLSTIKVSYKKEEWSFFVIVGGDRISINTDLSLTINALDSLLISFTHNDPNGVNLKSLDEDILTVDEEGLIETFKKGVTEVVISSNTNPNVSKTIAVVVLGSDEIIYDIEIENNVIVLDIDESKKINVKTNDDEGVSFTSSNDNVVIVDSLGNLTPVNYGEVEVTVKSISNPNVFKIVTVTVLDNRTNEEALFDEAIFNTVNLENYTLEFNILENYENQNYSNTITLMFDGNLTKFKADQIEEYYENVNGVLYEYVYTKDGFVKEEITASVSEGLLLYENFTHKAFNYNSVTNKYSLNASKQEYVSLLDDFISIFTSDENAAIVTFTVSLDNSLISLIEFMFVYEGYIFDIKINVKDVGTTLVEVPEYV